MLSYVYASERPMVGGQRDENNCLTGAGYSWCEDTQLCIRHWETPCADNFEDCDDCFKKQRKGINIACPNECNDIIVCPENVCMISCDDGYRLDENGCNLCSCNEPLIDMIPEPMISLSSTSTCPIVYEDCDSEYVCPKVTEVTHCSTGGIEGYTTYRISLIIKDLSVVKNIYAIFGSPDTITSSMVKPGAVVIDVGVNRTENGLVGDTSSDVKEVAGQLTPVPGGVGPMTVAMLMSNVVDAALKTG